MPSASPAHAPAAAPLRYRWLIWVLGIDSALLIVAPYLLLVVLAMLGGGMCNGCSVGWSDASALMPGFGWMLLGVSALFQIALSAVVYFVYRWIDRPPHRWRPLAVLLLLAYLCWPLLALIAGGASAP